MEERFKIYCNEFKFNIQELKRIKHNLPKNLHTFLDETVARYFELQYHGELRVDDISEICFTKGIRSQNTIDNLKSKGIKLYKIVGGDECVGI